MPRPYTISTVKPLKGMRSNTARSSLESGEFSKLENFNVNRGGYLEKRKGLYKVTGTKPVASTYARLLNIHRGIPATPTDYVFFGDTGILLRGTPVDNPVWTSITGAAGWTEWGFQWGWTGSDSSFCGVRRAATNYRHNPVTMGTTIVDETGPSGTFTLPYKSRMWIMNTMSVTGLENRLYFSSLGNFGIWISPSGGFIDIQPGDGQFLVCAIVYNDNLYVFKNRSIWMLNAESEDQTTYTPRMISGSLGCAGRGTVQIVDGFIYFYTGEAVYRTDGTTFEEISEPIRDKFITADYTDKQRILNTDAIYWDNKYILSTYTSTTKTMYIYDVVSEAWSTWTPIIDMSPMGFATYSEKLNELLYMGSYTQIGAGTNTGYYYATGADWFRDGTTGPSGGTSANDYSAIAEFGYSDMDTPGEYKRGFYNALDVQGTIADTLRLVDSGRTPAAVHSKALPDSSRRFVRFPGSGRYRAHAMDLLASTTAGQVPGSLKVYSAMTADQLREKANRLTGNAT